MPTETVVSPEKLIEFTQSYPGEIALAKAFGRTVVVDTSGVIRFKSNFAVRAFVDAGADAEGILRRNVPMDLNKLWILAHDQPVVPVEDLMKFYMDLGYSLNGFGEVFDQPRAHEWHLPGAIQPPERDEDDDEDEDEDDDTQDTRESPMDWMLNKLGIKVD